MPSGQRVRLRWVDAYLRPIYTLLLLTMEICPCLSQRIKGILNQSRKAHTDAVQSRITSVGEMKDVVDMTKAMFEVSKVGSQLSLSLLRCASYAGSPSPTGKTRARRGWMIENLLYVRKAMFEGQ